MISPAIGIANRFHPLQQVLDVPEGEMADRIELPASRMTMP